MFEKYSSERKRKNSSLIQASVTFCRYKLPGANLRFCFVLDVMKKFQILAKFKVENETAVLMADSDGE